MIRVYMIMSMLRYPDHHLSITAVLRDTSTRNCLPGLIQQLAQRDLLIGMSKVCCFR